MHWLIFVTIVLCVYVVIRLLCFISNQRKLWKSLETIPGPRYQGLVRGNYFHTIWPILRQNSARQVGPKLAEELEKLHDEYGSKEGLFKVAGGPMRPMIFICDPKLAKRIFSSPSFSDKASMYNIFASMGIGDSLITCKGMEVKRHRTMVKPYLSPAALEAYVANSQRNLSILNKRIDACIASSVKSGYIANVEEMVASFVLDSLGENLFGHQFNSSTRGIPSFVRASSNFVHHYFEFIALQPWLYQWFDSRLLSTAATMFAVVCGNAHKLRTVLANGIALPLKLLWSMALNGGPQIEQGFDFNKQSLDQCKNVASTSPLRQPLLIDAFFSQSNHIKPDARWWSNWWNSFQKYKEIFHHLVTFLMAGYDTTTSSITWLLYLLAHHPEVKQKLIHEIDCFLRELHERNEPLTVHSLKRLKYLDACIAEQLRLATIAVYTGRSAAAPFVVNDRITIPANVDVFIFHHYLCTSTAFHSNPKCFVPERFLGINQEGRSDEQAQPEQMMISPFGTGSRQCPGRDYSLMQIKLFMVNLCSRYEFEPTEQYDASLIEKICIFRNPVKFSIRFSRK